MQEYWFFYFISLQSSASPPIFHPSPLMWHATISLHGRICRGLMSHVAVACRTSQVCEQFKKKSLQQKCRSRMSHVACRKSHVCEHRLRMLVNTSPGILSWWGFKSEVLSTGGFVCLPTFRGHQFSPVDFIPINFTHKKLAQQFLTCHFKTKLFILKINIILIPVSLRSP